MKRITAIASVMVLAGLYMTFGIYGQSSARIKGTGISSDKHFSISGFHGIEVSSGFDVILVQGNSEDLILTAQENLFDHIVVKTEQGILKIYTEENVMTTQPLKARISFKSIDNLKVSGGGDITCETPINVPGLEVKISGGGDLTTRLNTDKMECNISGGGDAKIDGNIADYELDMTGGGDIKSNVKAKTIKCRISGGGDVTFNNIEKASEANLDLTGGGDLTVEINTEKLNCSISGGGDATFSGQAGILDLKLSGGGDVNAGNLTTNITALQISGGSDLHVKVLKELTGRISGGGNVYYSGTPQKITVDTQGGSEIHKQ